jgi:hypothetical protein
MPFSRRITLFIFGTLLGCFFVWAVLMRGRDFPAWTPEGRVLQQLRENPIRIAPKAACQLKCAALENNDILAVLQTAEVLFSESAIRGKETPEYVLEGEGLKKQRLKMKFRTEYTSTRLLEVLVKPVSDTCKCAE